MGSQKVCEALDLVVEFDKQRCNLEATLEAVEDPFHAVFIAIAQHRLLQREPFGPAIGETSLPAVPLAETGDGVFLPGDAGDVVAGLLDDPLSTARRAPAPARMAGMPQQLT